MIRRRKDRRSAENGDGPETTEGLQGAWYPDPRPVATVPRRGSARPQAPLAARAVAPLPGPGRRDDGGAADRNGRRPRTPLPGRQGGRQRDRAARLRRPDADRDRLPDLGPGAVGRHLRADLPRRLGRAESPAGSARAHLHAPAGDVDRVLHAQQARRADLAHDQRRAGARQPRHRRDRDPVLEHADAGRRRRHHARPRPAARADHLHHLPAAGAGEHRLPRRLGRRLQADPREDRQRHGLPAGDAERHPRRPQLRHGAAPHRRDGAAQRGEPGSQHAHRLAQRELLPGRRAAQRGRHRRHPAVRRLPGDRGQRRDRRADLVRRLPGDVLRPDPADQPALHDLPAGHGGARQDLRPARHRARHRRSSGRDRPGRDPRRDPARERLLLLLRRTRAGRWRRSPARRRPIPTRPSRRPAGRCRTST